MKRYGVRVSQLEYKTNGLRQTVKRLSKGIAKIRQERCAQKNYIKRMKMKHMKTCGMFAKVRHIMKINGLEWLRLKKMAHRFDSAFRYAGQSRKKKYVVYLTRNESTKLRYLLNKDWRHICSVDGGRG